MIVVLLEEGTTTTTTNFLTDILTPLDRRGYSNSCQWGHNPLELSWTTSIISGCMVNNTILYPEFVFKWVSLNLSCWLLCISKPDCLTDFLSSASFPKNGSYATLSLFWKVTPTVSVQISTASYNKIFSTRLWRVFPKNAHTNHKSHVLLVGCKKNLWWENLVFKRVFLYSTVYWICCSHEKLKFLLVRESQQFPACIHHIKIIRSILQISIMDSSLSNELEFHCLFFYLIFYGIDVVAKCTKKSTGEKV